MNSEAETSEEGGRPELSVVMPAYQHEKFVGEAIESVLKQGLRNLELVVIDDGSKDRTGEIVRAYAEKDKRVRYVYQENQDAYNALNHGLRIAKGRWLAIINSDDIFHPQRFERLFASQAQSGAACLFSDVSPVDDQGQPIPGPDHFWHQWHQRNRDYFFRMQDLYTGFLHGNFMVSTSNLLFSREVLEKVGFFSPLRYLHDYDYIFRILLAFPGRVQYVHDEVLLSYRIHGSNTLKEGAVKARLEDKQVIRTYLLKRFEEEAVQQLVATGADRLATLEREIADIQHSPVETFRASRPRMFMKKILGR